MLSLHTVPLVLDFVSLMLQPVSQLWSLTILPSSSPVYTLLSRGSIHVIGAAVRSIIGSPWASTLTRSMDQALLDGVGVVCAAEEGLVLVKGILGVGVRWNIWSC